MRPLAHNRRVGKKLPGWVVDNAESVRREAEPYRHMTPPERAAVMAAACRGAAKLLAARNDREALLRTRDPLPPSTVAALERLRREATMRGARARDR